MWVQTLLETANQYFTIIQKDLCFFFFNFIMQSDKRKIPDELFFVVLIKIESGFFS